MIAGKAPHLAEERREQIRELLMSAGAVTVADLQLRFGVSSMTVRRDLEELERRGYARRAHGGAVLPAIVLPENSFAHRVEAGSEVKQRLAEAVFAHLRAGETIFLDSSSTAFYVAHRIARADLRLRVVTNSGPIMHLLMERDDSRIDLYAIGGTLRRVSSSYVGPGSVAAVRSQFADRAILSVTGLARGAALTDADGLEAEVKCSMIEQAGESVLLLDQSKLAVHGRQVIAPLSRIDLVIADGLSAEQADRLRAQGPRVQLI